MNNKNFRNFLKPIRTISRTSLGPIRNMTFQRSWKGVPILVECENNILHIWCDLTRDKCRMKVDVSDNFASITYELLQWGLPNGTILEGVIILEEEDKELYLVGDDEVCVTRIAEAEDSAHAECLIDRYGIPKLILTDAYKFGDVELFKLPYATRYSTLGRIESLNPKGDYLEIIECVSVSTFSRAITYAYNSRWEGVIFCKLDGDIPLVTYTTNPNKFEVKTQLAKVFDVFSIISDPSGKTIEWVSCNENQYVGRALVLDNISPDSITFSKKSKKAIFVGGIPIKVGYNDNEAFFVYFSEKNGVGEVIRTLEYKD
jgi:hypothetical protein